MPYANPEDRQAFARKYHQRLKNDPHYKEVRKRIRIKYVATHKEVIRERRKKYEKANPEKIKAWSRKTNRNIRLFTIQLLGGKCVRCGNTDIRVLQVDHINGDGAKHRKEFNNKHSVLRAVILKELKSNLIEAKKRYQLLCANCNWIKVWEKKEYLGTSS